MNTVKPLGKKSYGSIPHISGSRLGVSDSKISEGQELIATVKTRDSRDIVIVQEKLDGSNVSVALHNGEIYTLTRAGYNAKDSFYSMHHEFDKWVRLNENRFRNILSEGERISGEWLHTAHGTIYHLPHEPFVAFDIFDVNNRRYNYERFISTVNEQFTVPFLISKGESLSVESALNILGHHGKHGAQEQCEGVIWRVERDNKVDFLCKYVRPDKIDGKYLKNENLILNKWVTQ